MLSHKQNDMKLQLLKGNKFGIDTLVWNWFYNGIQNNSRKKIKSKE